MKKIAILSTVIATFFFALSTYAYLYDPIAKSDVPYTHLFNFFLWYTIPILLWIAYLIFQESKKTNSIFPRFTINKTKENTNIYYLEENGTASEALTYNQLCKKNISRNTYVWRKGIEWTKAGELKELVGIFEVTTPPPFDRNKINKPSTEYRKHNQTAQILAVILLVIPILLFLAEILKRIGMV
jgi:hypothetical protein